jgi:Mycobacterium membrane protein
METSFTKVAALTFAAAAVSASVAIAPASAQSRTVVYEVTGSGTVYSIDLDPGGRIPEDTAAPFTQTVSIGPDVALLQVVVVTKTGSQGCRITLDGTVVAEQAPGDAAHCIAYL